MKFGHVFLLILFAGSYFTSVSQDTIQVIETRLWRNFLTNNEKWAIEIPVWIPGFRGAFSYGDVNLEGEDGVDLSPEQPIEKPGLGDIFKRIFKTDGSLNFVFMSRVTYTSNKIFAHFDGFSGAVGSSTKFRYNNAELVNAKFRTNLYRFFAGYEIVDKWSKSAKSNYRLYPYAGLRFHSIKLEADLEILKAETEIRPLWTEPIIGLRNDFSLKRWKFILNGDVGFLGKNGKMSYMINFNTYFRISNLLSVKVGWADWDTNYKGNYKGEDLKLEMHLSGPSAAISFHF